MNNFSVSEIQIKPITNSQSEELCEKVYRKCSFCSKKCQQSSILNKISGDKGFHCTFCLRNNFHTKINRDIFILSFRQIIAHLYSQHYLCEPKKFWLSEIEDLINLHQKIGLKNPVFNYDPETMLWFINFSKVGSGKKQIPITEVLKIIIQILACFNFSENIPTLEIHKFYQKYKIAIENFFHQRQKSVSIPPLFDVLFSSDQYANFIFQNLKPIYAKTT